MSEINQECLELAAASSEKGFHTDWDNVPEKLMLVVTELAEVMEVYRKKPISQWVAFGKGMHITSMREFEIQETDIEHFEEEMADVFIRMMALSGALGLDIDKAIAAKVERNKSRPFMHGKSL